MYTRIYYLNYLYLCLTIQVIRHEDVLSSTCRDPRILDPGTNYN